ncbi:hypothetical protein BDV27DRAFT_147770 [Aspergillus caelatus]|uniref:Polyketide synthase n=1 Tax=Aspergillus caelatus TaxID=61420 RepID=A0A5N6ZV63_9EURO|nr:uncharacterized protein BDV27DRAFT_147770 [Aspergillus caelatus]KAE8361501.1 hypothetical protein BDV27DRAFT_147770 [Aspergillus caelatus]
MMDFDGGSSQDGSAYTPQSYEGNFSSRERIAIVGMSARMPGDVSNPVEFWNLCGRARSGWSEIPPERFSPETYYHPNAGNKGTHNARGGHFLSENVALFDAPFFNVTTAEATAMDPQQRLLLEGTFEAFENAGISRSEVMGQKIGVFMGGYGPDYQLLGHKDTETVPMYFATGTCKGLMSNRVSYYFDLRGPSVTVDTACSSSLVALHLACQSLRAGESTAAVVGGVHLNISPDSFPTILFSETGKSYAFDHRGTGGYGRGEDVGCLILKRLSDALESNDRIRAVIVNSGTNQDGRTNGITMPNGSAQEDLIRSDVGFVEAHGTGTKVGDPIEAKALANVLGRGRTGDDPLLVGSVKTNVGHLEAASRVASLIKAAMMLERGFILPHRDFERFPTSISTSLNIKVPTRQIPWPANKRYISINNFGFGGANAHVVLEKGCRPAAPVEECVDVPGSDKQEPRRLFVLSAHDEKAARARERRFVMPWMIALTATELSDLPRQLVDRQSRPVRSKQPTAVSFLFTGQGAQWHAMGRELLMTYPVFSTTLLATDAVLTKLGADFSLIEELSKDEETTQVNEPHISQPICTALQIALVDLLHSWNIKPSAVTGHSSGEIACAYASNALSLEDCMAIAYHRGRTARWLVGNSTLPPGAMLAVGAGPDEIKGIMSSISHGRIGIACVNSPSSVTISGDRVGILQLDRILEGQGIFHRILRVNVAYHSHHMQAVADDYHASIAHIRPKYSCSANLTSTVLFADSLSDMCSYEATANGPSEIKFRTTVLLEVGHHAGLEGPIKQTVPDGFSDGSLVYASMLRRTKDATETAQKATGELLMRGVPIDIGAINRPVMGTSLPQVLSDMPPYPFRHDTPYWHSSRVSQKYLSKERPPRNEIIGALADYSNVTFPMAGFITMGIEAALQCRKFGLGGFNLQDFAIQRPLVLDEYVEVEMVTRLSPFMLGPHTSSVTWNEFVVSSWTQQRGWIQHCRGLVSIETESPVSEGSTTINKFAEYQDGKSPWVTSLRKEKVCRTQTDCKAMYSSLEAIGTGYGMTLQGLKNIAISGGGELTVAELLVPDTAATMPQVYEKKYLVHPTVLETAFQAVWPLIGAGITGLNTLYMVTVVKQMSISCGMQSDAGSALRVLASPKLLFTHDASSVQKRDEVQTEADTSFSLVVAPPNNHDQALISLDGLMLLPVHQSENLSLEQSARGLCYKVDWKPVLEEAALNRSSSSASSDDTCSEGSSGPSFVLLDPVTIIYRQEDQFDIAFKISKTLEQLTGSPVELEPFGASGDGANNMLIGVIIFHIDIGRSVLASLSGEEFWWLKDTALRASGLLWVSCNAYAGHQDPNAHLITGLARCIRSENEKRFAVLDLEAKPAHAQGQVCSTHTSYDMEYRVRNGQLQVPRVVYDYRTDSFVQSEAHGEEILEIQPFYSRDKELRSPLKLSISSRGALDSIYFIPDPIVGAPLEANEVEIEIKATAINAKDISQVMGHASSSFIGMECSGIVTHVGSLVRHFSVVDRVCALNTKGAYSQFTRCRYTSVSHIPEEMAFVTGATIPAAYCEIVLIHAGASDIGLAAIKLAHYIGAEIYVTVKSAIEKQFLMDTFKDILTEGHILYHEEALFGAGLRQETSSREGDGGVDVILNSFCVSGDSLRQTWECIAHFGRFIEIGKRDIEADSWLPMRPFYYNTTFSSVDIAVIANEKPQLMKRLMSDVFTMIRNGIVAPLPVEHTKSISEVVEAFSLVQSGEVINKVVLSHGEEDQAPIPPLPMTLLHANATYIFIGGTGGLGREITRWVISKGARNLLLLSRSGSMGEEAARLIQDATINGVVVMIQKCDITDQTQVRQVLQELVAVNKLPVRGIIQGSMVFDNMLLEDMQYPLWQRVIAPKVAGTWNLHHELQAGGHEPDFFIMLSSISGIIGSRGQAPYAAANAFLDEFAAFRQAQGLPATTIDIAPVVDAGRLAEDNLGDAKIFSKRFASDSISQKEVMALLGAAIYGDLPAGQSQCLTGLKLTSELIKFRFWAYDPRFESLLKEAELSLENDLDTHGGAKSLDSAVKEAQAQGEAQALDVVYTSLSQKIADILMNSVEDIHPTSSVATCGLDSLAAVEFRNWISRELHAQLQILEIITSSNLEVLSRTVLSRRK